MSWLRHRSREVVEQTVPVFDTDARRMGGPQRRGEPDPEQIRADKLKRRVLILGFNVIFIGGLLAALLGQGGYFDLMRLRTKRDVADRDLVQQQQRVEALEHRIDRLLHDPMARERIAREQLGMARPGEIQFLLPRDRPGLLDEDEQGESEAPRTVPDSAD
jgi:cell division protein FtsB